MIIFVCKRKSDRVYKTMTAGKRQLAELNTSGLPLNHNYFREHEGLAGKTPAQVAGIRVEGKNKRMTVIQNASRKN